MADIKKEGEVTKVDHKNIFAALAAFHAENPEIKKTKQFGKEGDKMSFKYAPLDEILNTVRPLTAKHGLAFVWEPGANPGEIVCSLYHETYEVEKSQDQDVISKKIEGDASAHAGAMIHEVVFARRREMNVLRSAPIKVSRAGDMKGIGADSTYARRYTLSEVLGIAPEDDNDAGSVEARREQAEKAMFTRAKTGIEKAKSVKELDASEKVFNQNLAEIKAGKTPSLGLAEPELNDLLGMVSVRRSEFVGTGAPGENQDAGGDATIPAATEKSEDKGVEKPE